MQILQAIKFVGNWKVRADACKISINNPPLGKILSLQRSAYNIMR